MALQEIRLYGSDDGTVDTTKKAHGTHDGNSIFIRLSDDEGGYDVDPLNAVFLFDRVRTLKKYHWEGVYLRGWTNDEGDWIRLNPQEGQYRLKIYAIPEGEADTRANWITIGYMSPEYFHAGGSSDRWSGHPNEVRSPTEETLVQSHQLITPIRCEGIAVEVAQPTPAGSFEMLYAEAVKQIDLRCWEDDSDYFIGYPISLTGTDTGSLDVSGGNTYDGDLDTYDETSAWASGSPEDAIWTFGATKTLARVVICAMGIASNPAQGCFGAGGGYMKVFYQAPDDSWVEMYAYTSPDDDAYYPEYTDTFPYPNGVYNGGKCWFDVRPMDGSTPTVVEAKAIKVETLNGEGGDTARIYEIMAFSGEAKAMELYSNSGDYTAESAPDEIRAIIIYKAFEAISLNTDLILSVSRDGGSNWTAVTLADATAPYNDNLVIATGSADVSGQDSDTDIMWKVVTTAKKIRIDGVSLMWG